MSYPVGVTVAVQETGRQRLTSAFRPLLAIPHALLVGPVYWSSRSGGAGFLGGAAYVMSIVSWCLLLVTGEQPRGIREFSLYYLRWRTRALAYMALFVDLYPPFGEGDYPAAIEVGEPPAMRDRTSIALRLLYAIPHLVLLVFLVVCWFITTVIAWLAILFTGEYPASLAPFGVGVMRWMLRVEAYLLLLVDEYPPFALE
jgi:hypothetical protein